MGKRMLQRFVLLCMVVFFIPLAAWGEGSHVIQYVSHEDSRPAAASYDLLEVHFIDVGAADCILLRMGNETMMVDNGNLETADRVIAYLETIGVDRLTYAFASHPHNDHICGYIPLLQQVPVEHFLLPALYDDYRYSAYRSLLSTIEGRGIPLKMLFSGDEMRLGNAQLTFYQWEKPKESVNNRSMITMARLGERSILFAADIENRAQKALAESWGPALRADILKMPHHGLAAYMREFHAAVNPRLLTFSNTRRKIRQTLVLAERRNVDWMLTTGGSIVAATDGKDHWQIWQLPKESAN